MSFKEQVEKAFARKEAEKRAQRLESINAYFEQHVGDLPERCANFLRDAEQGVINPSNHHLEAKAQLGLYVPIKLNDDLPPLTHEEIYSLSGFRKLHDLLRSEEYNIRLAVEIDDGALRISVSPTHPYHESYLVLASRGGRDNLYKVETCPVPPAETTPAPQAAPQATAQIKPKPRHIKLAKGKKAEQSPL